VHLIAARLHDQTALLGKLTARSRDFHWGRAVRQSEAWRAMARGAGSGSVLHALPL